MKPIKILALLITSAFLIAPVEASKKGAARKKKQEEKQQKREENARKRDAISDFMKERDKNNDGSLTKEEFLSGETNKEEGEKKFDRYNKNKDRYLSKAEIAEMLGF